MKLDEITPSIQLVATVAPSDAITGSWLAVRLQTLIGMVLPRNREAHARGESYDPLRHTDIHASPPHVTEPARGSTTFASVTVAAAAP